MKKVSKIFLIIFIIGFVFIFSACSNTNQNLFKNSYFIDRADSESILPSNWKIYSPDTDNIEVRAYPTDINNAGQDDNSNLKVTIKSEKNSYIQVTQKVKLKKNTIYCLSYKAQLRKFAYADGSDKIGVHPIILEDKDMPNAPDYKITDIISNNSSWRTTPYVFYFNSNNNTELTVGIALGSEDALCMGEMFLSGVKLNSVGRGIIAENSVHNVVKNKGYSVSLVGEILFTVLISVAFAGLFLLGVWLLCVTYIKRKTKRVKVDEFNIPSDDELLNEQKILTEPINDPKSVENISDPVKFDKEKLDALFSEDIDKSSEIISEIANDIIFKTSPSEEAIESGHEEVETITVGKKSKKFKLNAGWILLITMLAALAVRIVLATLIRGFRADFNLLIKYIDSIQEHGITQFYNRNDTFFSAGGVYILSVINMLIGLFNVNIMSPGGAFLIKLPAIIADLLTALIIYKAASKYINKNFAVVVAGLYMFNPAVFMNSAVWGAVDSVYTLLLVLTFYMLVEKKTLLCFLCYTFAVLLKVNALSVAPILIIYFGYRFVTSIIYMIKHRADGFKHNIKGEGSAVWRLPAYTLGAFILFYLLAMPVALSEIQGDFFFPINHLIFWAAGDLTYYSNNGFNFFSMLGRNGAELGDKFPTQLLTALFVIIVAAIVAIIYIARHNRANIVMLASYSVFALTFFLTDMKPVYTLPAIALLIFAICLNKDRRLLLVYGMISIVNFVNQAIVMTFSHNLNNLPDYMLDAAQNPLYNGSNYIDGEAGFVINIIFGIIMFAIFAYYTYLTLEIGLGNRRRKIIPLDYNKKTFFTALKSIIR